MTIDVMARAGASAMICRDASRMARLVGVLPGSDTEVACLIVRQPAPWISAYACRDLSPDIGREVVLVFLAEDASLTTQLVATGEPVRPVCDFGEAQVGEVAERLVEKD